MIFIAVLLLLLIVLYFLIPKSYRIEAAVSINANAKGFQRSLMNENNWPKWWPGEATDKKNRVFSFDGLQYTIIDKTTSGIVVNISGKGETETTILEILPFPDSVVVAWKGIIHSPAIGFSRITNYFRQGKLEKDLGKLLEQIHNFYSKHENIYGIVVKEEKVLDSTLLQNYTVVQGYPTIDTIYSLIDELQKYTASQNAKQTGVPMLNISTEDSLHFLTRVAIPVDRPLQGSHHMSYKWMLPHGNILVTEIKGGPKTISRAFHQLEEYIADHTRLAPAIPFESLVTDRRVKKDTSKWITKIYYPVM